MGLYSDYIFPRVMDLMCSQPDIVELRRSVLAEARGDVLEPGIGTGLNLPHYPSAVRSVTGVDPNPGMSPLAAKRIAAAAFPVKHVQLGTEKLPFEAGSFDTAVLTFTLCSVADPVQALAEIRRVLRPDGVLLFLEHGLSPDPGVRIWQKRLNPLNQIIAAGCRLDRDVEGLVGAAFKLARVEKRYHSGAPRPMGYFTSGTARL